MQSFLFDPCLEDRTTIMSVFYWSFGSLEANKNGFWDFPTFIKLLYFGYTKIEEISPNCGSLVCTICVPVIAISCKSNQSFIKLSMYMKYSIQLFFFRTKPRNTNKFKVTAISSCLFLGTYRNTKFSSINISIIHVMSLF